jgi:hypothetical protein
MSALDPKTGKLPTSHQATDVILRLPLLRNNIDAASDAAKNSASVNKNNNKNLQQQQRRRKILYNTTMTVATATMSTTTMSKTATTPSLLVGGVSGFGVGGDGRKATDSAEAELCVEDSLSSTSSSACDVVNAVRAAAKRFQVC